MKLKYTSTILLKNFETSKYKNTVAIKELL